jgi:hypothetical protein
MEFAGLVVTDINEDSYPDLALATADFGVRTMFNSSIRGTVNYNAPEDLGPTGIASKHITGEDFDGDGKLDLAMINLFSRSALVYKNRYTPADTPYYRQPLSYIVTPSPHTPTDIISGDIDGDGKPDIATCTISQPYLTVLRNKVGDPARLCPNGGTTLSSAMQLPINGN